MNQRQHWKQLRPVLDKAKLHPVRVEDPRLLGLPDVNFSHGWIELKQVEKPPRGASRFGATENQWRWMHKRWECEGGVWVSIAVGNEFFLITGKEFARHMIADTLTYAALQEDSCAIGLQQYPAALWLRTDIIDKVIANTEKAIAARRQSAHDAWSNYEYNRD